MLPFHFSVLIPGHFLCPLQSAEFGCGGGASSGKICATKEKENIEIITFFTTTGSSPSAPTIRWRRKARRDTARRLRGRRGESRGFTLTELIITLGLIAVVGAIAMPSFNRMTVNSNLRSTARDIQGRIAYLKERAMADNTQYTLTFDKDNNRYRSSDMKSDEWKHASSFGQGIQITDVNFGGGSRVAFETRGTLAQGGNIVLANGRGSTATITCNLSGRTYVQFQMK